MATTTRTTEPRNYTYLAAKTIVRGIAGLAVTMSFMHIVHLFEMLGLHGWQAFAMPAFIDGFAILGLIARGRQFTPETRKLGLRFQIAATLVSLSANIGAGQSAGGRIGGALVVVGYVAAEILSDKMSPVATAAQTAQVTRSAAAVKAAVTRAANKAKAEDVARRKAERAEANRLARKVREAELQAAERGEFAGTAPVSPAPVGYL